jgi:alpha-L-fucosidase
MLVDIVSRNGNLMLNFPLMSSGVFDSQEEKILEAITAWMAANSEAIHGTRPWKVYGAGPSTQPAAADAKFSERTLKDFTADDLRFTTKGRTLYAFCMGRPDTRVVIGPLGTSSSYGVGRITSVELLGSGGPLKWVQYAEGLTIQPPTERVSDYAIAFRIMGALTT